MQSKALYILTNTKKIGLVYSKLEKKRLVFSMEN